MEKYKVLDQVGEGSFGQVFKGKKCSDGEIVAIKVIRKRGRSCKELRSLRQECEIQKHLHHPNIVQMIDSFETETEIVVVTEYADKELYDILGKTGRLSEERTQVIACDLVSALYYLHSNRVLHRDLKPQNVLVESNGVAKLCDFGFARSMSTGTHVLTSIKGTPLYMAPELIEEYPYDHNADLWSLGCIIYELIVGTPPFQTTSILHLVRLIRFESIKWPDFISKNCKNFLQGLLQKDPSKRLTWPQLLEHSFVKGRILIINCDNGISSLTTPLSESQALAKKKQLKILTENNSKLIDNSSIGSVDVLLGNLSLRASLQSDLITIDDINYKNNEINLNSNDNLINNYKINSRLSDWDINVIEQHIENEEWVVFLQKSMEEIIDGEITSLLQDNCVSVFVSPLRNSNSGCKVIEFVSCLLSLPFVIDIDNDNLKKIEKIYLDVRVVPNLVYAIKLFMIKNNDNNDKNLIRSASSMSADELQTIECIMVILCRLIHINDKFLTQFCDAVYVVDGFLFLKELFTLEIRKPRIVADLVAILNNILRLQPENAELVEKILLNDLICVEQFTKLLIHKQIVLRIRTCILIKLLAKFCCRSLQLVWGKNLRNLVEELANDDNERIKQNAVSAIIELKQLNYYYQQNPC